MLPARPLPLFQQPKVIYQGVLTTRPLEDREFQFIYHTWQTLFFQVQIKKNCYGHCYPGPSNELVPQIEPHPNSCQYPLMNYRVAASGSESSRSSTPPKAALKKRAAPRPPAINSVKSEGSSREASPVSSSKSSVVSNAMPDDVDSITTVVEHNKKQQMQKQ
jgi:hypothetical protein